MKHPLSAPQAKIQRAKKHLAEFEAETTLYLAACRTDFGCGHVEHPGYGLLVWLGMAWREVLIGFMMSHRRLRPDLGAGEAILASDRSAEGEHPLDVPGHGHEAPLATHVFQATQ